MSYFISDSGDGVMKLKKASLTVEATFIMPIFIMAVLVFLYLLQLVTVHEQIQGAISEVAAEAAQYAYLYEEVVLNKDQEKDSGKKTEEQKKNKTSDLISSMVNGLASGYMLDKLFQDALSKYDMYDTCIVNGREGISLNGSSFMGDKEHVYVEASYQVEFPVLFFSIPIYSVVQSATERGFIGLSCNENNLHKENDNNDDEIVYITKNGTVYHENSNCTYLKVKTTRISIVELESKRNDSGAIYYPCEECLDGNPMHQGFCYIAEYGDRYHSNINCKKIYRNIITIPKSKVGNRKPCSKCSK